MPLHLPPADRFNEGKPEMSYLLDIPHAMRALVAVFQQGAIKYERGNWKRGGKPDEEYLDSALRHIMAFRDEVYDRDVGTQHVANAIWNLIALIELNYPEWDSVDPAFDQTEFESRYDIAADPIYPEEQKPDRVPVNHEEWHQVHVDWRESYRPKLVGGKNPVDL